MQLNLRSCSQLTVRRPSSVPALNTLMAISPRLAAMIFLKGTSPVWNVCTMHAKAQHTVPNSSKLLSVGCSAAGLGAYLEPVIVTAACHNISVGLSFHVEGLNAWLLRHSCWYYTVMPTWWAGAHPPRACCWAYIQDTRGC